MRYVPVLVFAVDNVLISNTFFVYTERRTNVLWTCEHRAVVLFSERMRESFYLKNSAAQHNDRYAITSLFSERNRPEEKKRRVPLREKLQVH